MKRKIMTMIAVASFLSASVASAQENEGADTSAILEENQKLFAGTEHVLHPPKSLDRTWLDQVMPYEVYGSLLVGGSDNLFRGLSIQGASSSTLRSTTPNGSFLLGGALGVRMLRHSIEPTWLFSTIPTGNLADPRLNVYSMHFFSKVTEFSIKYKYLLWFNRLLGVQVGGFLGALVSSQKFSASAQYNFSYDALAPVSQPRLDIRSQPTVYATAFVGGLVEVNLWLGRRFSLSLELDAQYNMQPFQGTLSYGLYQYTLQPPNGSKSVVRDETARATLAGYFFFIRPFLKASYHFPLRATHHPKYGTGFVPLAGLPVPLFLPLPVLKEVEPIDPKKQKPRDSNSHFYVGLEGSGSFLLHRQISYSANPQGHLRDMPVLPSMFLNNRMGMMPYVRFFWGFENQRRAWEFSYAFEQDNRMLIPVAFEDPARDFAFYPSAEMNTMTQFLEASYMRHLLQHSRWQLMAGGLVAAQIAHQSGISEQVQESKQGQTLSFSLRELPSSVWNVVLGLRVRGVYMLTWRIGIYAQVEWNAVPYAWRVSMENYGYASSTTGQTIHASTFLTRIRPALGVKFRIY